MRPLQPEKGLVIENESDPPESVGQVRSKYGSPEFLRVPRVPQPQGLSRDKDAAKKTGQK